MLSVCVKDEVRCLTLLEGVDSVLMTYGAWSNDRYLSSSNGGLLAVYKKLQVRGRFFKKLYRDGLKLPRRQEADSMTATCWHSKILCLFLLRGWWSRMRVQMMPRRIGINVECCTLCCTIRALCQGLHEGKSWHFMLCQMHFWSLSLVQLVQLRWD